MTDAIEWDNETVSTHLLKPYERNPRTCTKRQFEILKSSIERLGFHTPILATIDYKILGGHQRLRALAELGIKDVPVRRARRELTDKEFREINISSNLNAGGWDLDMLSTDFDVAELLEYGFPEALLGIEKEKQVKEGLTDDDATPEPAAHAVTKQGDVWLLGAHKLLCGDAIKAEDYQTLLGDELADMTFTDPPYNVNYANTAKDKMRGKNRPILNDNLGDGFGAFLVAACQNILTVTNGAVYIAMSSSELDTLQSAFRTAGGKWSTFIIWAKNTFTMGGADYQRQYEPILYGWRDGTAHFWCGARDQGDVWNIKRPQKNDMHPTMKPVELVERAVRNSSKTQDIVLDPFGGSGTTLIACEKTGRRARLIELDPQYVDVIVRRWQDFTGQEAIREVDSVSFATAMKSIS